MSEIGLFIQLITQILHIELLIDGSRCWNRNKIPGVIEFTMVQSDIFLKIITLFIYILHCEMCSKPG